MAASFIIVLLMYWCTRVCFHVVYETFCSFVHQNDASLQKIKHSQRLIAIKKEEVEQKGEEEESRRDMNANITTRLCSRSHRHHIVTDNDM